MAASGGLMVEMVRYGVPVIGALGGAFLGAFISGKSQNRLFIKQKQWDDEKEKRKALESVLKIYNSVLKLDGEHMIIEPIGGGHRVEFNSKAYSLYFRPVLYENFHLIDQNIADLVLCIDNRLRLCDVHEEIDEDDHSYLCKEYDLLIVFIKGELASFRKSHMDRLTPT